MDNSTMKCAFAQMVLEKKLKASDHGCVYLVRDKNTRERYFYRSFQGDGAVYRKMQGIRCPYLPAIYEVKEENGTVYVLEEYIQGDTLAFLLEGKPLAPEYAEKITIQLCRALEILHGLGAVHRDIKPENIIIRGDNAVLIDFDASRLCKAESTTDTRIMGTTGYAAPEQYGFSQTDARADIYALGILLNEMLTRQHPSKQLAQGKFRPIIEKATRINADQRYASVGELIAALEPPRKTHKPMIFAVLALLLAVIILCVGMFLSPSAPEEKSQNSSNILCDEIPTGKEGLTAEGYATLFNYDLDGDGQEEEYLFGVDFISSPHEYVVYYEMCDFLEGGIHPRTIHPCVWRVNSDGTMDVMEEFAALLTDTQSSISRVYDFDSPDPEMQHVSYQWDGAISVIFAPVQEETWMYQVSANLDGQELTAHAPFRYIPSGFIS